MPTIVIARTMPHVQVDVPDEIGTVSLERSRKGALHMRPGTMQVTEDELAWLQAQHKSLARHYRVLDSPPSPPPKLATGSAPKGSVKTEPTPDQLESGASSKKSRRRSQKPGD